MTPTSFSFVFASHCVIEDWKIGNASAAPHLQWSDEQRRGRGEREGQRQGAERKGREPRKPRQGNDNNGTRATSPVVQQTKDAAKPQYHRQQPTPDPNTSIQTQQVRHDAWKGGEQQEKEGVEQEPMLTDQLQGHDSRVVTSSAPLLSSELDSARWQCDLSTKTGDEISHAVTYFAMVAAGGPAACVA